MNSSIWNLVLFAISTLFSIFLFIITISFRLLITADIPISYSSGEAKFFIVLLTLTTFTLILMIIFSKNFILPVTLILGAIMLLFLVNVMRSYYYFGFENIDVLTTWSMYVVFMVPTILGIAIMIKRRRLLGK